MKQTPNSLRLTLRSNCALVVLAALSALPAVDLAAATYQWLGTSNSTWGEPTNWNSTNATFAFGVAPTGGTFAHRININNGASGSEAVYSADLGNTTYAPNERGVAIGSGTLGSGTLRITGGKFSTIGATSSDIIGNTSGNTGRLILDGGDYETSKPLLLGFGGGVISYLTVGNGTATVEDIQTNNQSGEITLNTGGTLAMNRIVHSGTGNTFINFNGGTLKSRISTTEFYPNPITGNALGLVLSGGALFDTNGFNVTFAPALLEDALSPGGGVTKNGNGTLTLGSPTTVAGNVTINAGGLGITAGNASWTPASITHSGTVLGINLDVYNPARPVAINVPSLTLNTANITLNISGSSIPVSSEIKILDYGAKSGAGSLQLNVASLPVNMAATLHENTTEGYYYLNVTSASATTYTWGTTGTGTWDTSSLSWNASSAAYAEPALVGFPNISGGGNVTIASDVAPLSLTVDNAIGNPYTFSGTGKIGGSTGITKTGTGIAIFDGAAHSYSGNLTIIGASFGSLTVGAIIKKKADDTTGKITVSSDGVTFVLDGGVTDGAGQTLVMSGRGSNSANYFYTGSAVQRGALQAHNGASTWQGDVVMALNDTTNPNRIGVQNGASLTLTGNITESVAGASLLFRAGNATSHVTLGGSSTYGYTGRSLIFSNGASIILGANNKLPAATSIVMDLGGTSIFDLNGFNQLCSTITGSADHAATANAARILNNNSSTPSTLTVSPALGVSGYFMGSLANGTGVLSLVKSGEGSQALASANTYTGNTTIQAGRLEIGGGRTTGALNPASTIINNSILAINRSNAVTQGTDFAHGISGTGRLIKEGAGALTLTSANTYAGNTTISTGTLNLSGNGTVGVGQVALATGTTFNVTAATPASISLPGGLRGNGTVNATGKTLSIGGAFAPVAQTITGNVSLTSNTTTTLVAGDSLATTSQLVVTGTVLNAGSLQINSSANLTFTSGQNFTFATASGGITPGFGAVSVGALALSSGSPGTWSGTSGNLTYTYNESAASLAVATVQFTALQTWRQQFFGSTENSGNGGDLVDFDNDGLVNLMEYALGTDPTVASPDQVVAGRSGNFLTLTYPVRSPADPALTYTVQGSSDLTTGFTTATGSTASGSPSVYTDNVDVSAPGTRRFLRLMVTYTPAP